MALKYELTAKTGTYTDKSGQDKARYIKCGAIFETKNGLSIKLDALPVNFDGWLNMWEPKEKVAREPGEDDDLPQ